MPKSGVEHLANHPGWKTQSTRKSKSKREKQYPDGVEVSCADYKKLTARPYLIIEVSGGVVQHVHVEGNAEYDIIYWDPDPVNAWEELSDREKEYIRTKYPDDYNKFRR
jgi:hypothetical protein